jgi:hypothetical protein
MSFAFFDREKTRLVKKKKLKKTVIPLTSTDVLLGHLDDRLLERLQLLPRLLVGARDHTGRTHGELEPLAPHVLDQDGDVQLPSARHDKLVGRVPGLHPQSQVALELAVEALLEIAGGDELALAPGEGTRVDREGHADGGLLDGDRRQRVRALALADGLSDGDVGKAGDGADVSGLGERKERVF